MLEQAIEFTNKKFREAGRGQNHFLRILFIREFLNHYPDSSEKNLVYKLTEELEKYVTV